MNKVNTIYTAMYNYITMLNSIGYASIEYYAMYTMGCVILESTDPYLTRPGSLMFMRPADMTFDRLFTPSSSSLLQLCTYSYQLHRLENLYAAFLLTLPLR